MTRRKALIASLLLLVLGSSPVRLPLFGQQQIIRTLYTETATIAINQSLSGTVDLKGRALVGIVMPAAWTTAQITFQVSLDGTTFNDLYQWYGDEFILEAATGRFVVIGQSQFLPIRYVKVRSGTAGTPVNQAAARTIVLATRDVDGK